MKKPAKRKKIFRKNQDGTALIEFAILAPVFFLLLMGIIEMALFMYAVHILENATTASARYGMTGSAYSKDKCAASNRKQFIRCSVQKLSHGLLDPGKVNIQTQIVDDFDSVNPAFKYNDPTKGKLPLPSFGIGNKVVIYHVTYNWKFFTPLVGKFFTGGDGQGTYVISSNVLVRNENFGDTANPNQPKGP